MYVPIYGSKDGQARLVPSVHSVTEELILSDPSEGALSPIDWHKSCSRNIFFQYTCP